MTNEYTIARLKVRGQKFEIIVDPDKALEYKLGRRKEFKDVLLCDEVFSDAKKGLRHAKKDLIEVFKTDNIEKIAQEILEKGELLIKAKQREKMIEEKKRQIIAYISKYCVDARTGAPIPPLRIERALGEAGVRIDPFKEVETQIPEIINKLSQVIPIKKLVIRLSVKIPSIYVGKAYGYVKSSSEIEKEEWLSDGSYYAEVSIPAGFKNEFIERLLNLTKGAAYVEVCEEKVI